MKIKLNNAEELVSEDISLEAYLKSKSLENAKGLAVAINSNVIPKNDWASTIIQENDGILIIGATRGG